MLIGSQVGTCLGGPIHTRMRLPNQVQDLRDENLGGNPLQRIDCMWDFLGAAVDLTNDGLKLKDISPAGAPVAALIANKHQYQVALSNTNEISVVGLDMADTLDFQANARPVFMARIRPDVLPAAATERMVFGFASAYNATLDNITLNAWLRVESGGLCYVEGDDNGTDTNLQAAVGITTLVAGLWYVVAVDLQGNPGYARVFVAPDQGPFRMVGQVAVPAMPATNMQPVAYAQKDSGVTQPGFSVDYVRVRCDRV